MCHQFSSVAKLCGSCESASTCRPLSSRSEHSLSCSIVPRLPLSEGHSSLCYLPPTYSSFFPQPLLYPTLSISFLPRPHLSPAHLALLPETVVMDASGQYHVAAGREAVQVFSHPHALQYSENPSFQGGLPLLSPMNFPTAPVQLGPMPATHIPLQQALGLHPAVMNNISPTPLPPAPVGRPGIATFHHGPMAEPQPEVSFDPATPPPFVDRAQMHTPRRNGVFKITNVSFSCITTLTILLFVF